MSRVASMRVRMAFVRVLSFASRNYAESDCAHPRGETSGAGSLRFAVRGAATRSGLSKLAECLA